MTATGSTTTESYKRGSRVRTFAAVKSLEALVGAHPDALQEIYQSGKPADPTAFDGRLRGRLLTVEGSALRRFYLITRPAMRFTSSVVPWEGKRFESGGTFGTDVVLGRDSLRFRCEVGDSRLDGEPTLVMSYDGLDNPWLFARSVDELRQVGETVAIGPGFLNDGGAHLWYGLETG